LIVTDAMKTWEIGDYTPETLKKKFGTQMIQVYNDLFDLQTVTSLEDYLDKNFGRKHDEERCRQYVRGYSKLKEVKFF